MKKPRFKINSIVFRLADGAVGRVAAIRDAADHHGALYVVSGQAVFSAKARELAILCKSPISPKV